MPTPLRKGVPIGTIAWSDGTPFDGVMGIGLKGLVNGSGAAWPTIALSNQAVRRPVPVWAPIPIIEGAFSTEFGVYYNADLNPPNSQYIAYIYDNNGVQVAGPTIAFTVSTPTFTPPSLTLTLPSVGSSPSVDS